MASLERLYTSYTGLCFSSEFIPNVYRVHELRPFLGKALKKLKNTSRGFPKMT